MAVRLISPNPRYSLQLFSAAVKRGTDSSGTLYEYTESEPVVADFRQLGLTEWEQIAALQHFSFAGLADGVHPLSQVSCWDSEAAALQKGWSPEYLARVDERARELAAHFPANVLVVDKPRTGKPWESYDEMDDVEEILATLGLIGNDPATVRLYEVENKNRPEVVSAIEQLQTEATPEFQEQTELQKLRQELDALKVGAIASPVAEGVASTETAAPVNPRAAALEKARAVKAQKLADAKAAAEVVEVDA